MEMFIKSDCPVSKEIANCSLSSYNRAIRKCDILMSIKQVLISSFSGCHIRALVDRRQRKIYKYKLMSIHVNEELWLKLQKLSFDMPRLHKKVISY